MKIEPNTYYIQYLSKSNVAFFTHYLNVGDDFYSENSFVIDSTYISFENAGYSGYETILEEHQYPTDKKNWRIFSKKYNQSIVEIQNIVQEKQYKLDREIKAGDYLASNHCLYKIIENENGDLEYWCISYNYLGINSEFQDDEMEFNVIKDFHLIDKYYYYIVNQKIKNLCNEILTEIKSLIPKEKWRSE